MTPERTGATERGDGGAGRGRADDAINEAIEQRVLGYIIAGPYVADRQGRFVRFLYQPHDYCKDDARGMWLLRWLAAKNTTPSLHRGPSLAHNTVEWFAVVYNEYGTSGSAHDPLPGRALALAALRAYGVEVEG